MGVAWRWTEGLLSRFSANPVSEARPPDEVRPKHGQLPAHDWWGPRAQVGGRKLGLPSPSGGRGDPTVERSELITAPPRNRRNRVKSIPLFFGVPLGCEKCIMLDSQT